MNTIENNRTFCKELLQYLHLFEKFYYYLHIIC